MERTRHDLFFREFERRRDGMIYAMTGGLWLHRHVWKGKAMAHLVSTDRDRLLAWGSLAGLSVARLQYKPLKDPRSGHRRHAWHWDLVGRYLPPRTALITDPTQLVNTAAEHSNDAECKTA